LPKNVQRIVVPYLDLYRFFKILTMKDPSKAKEKLGLKEKTIKAYMNFGNLLFGEEQRDIPPSFEEFLDVIRENLFQKLPLHEVLSEMESKAHPLNSTILLELLRKRGIAISMSSCKALLSLLKKLGVVSSIPKTVYSKAPEDLVLSYILSKGEVKFSDIKKKFPIRDIDDIIVKLWAEGKIEIPGLNVPRELVKKFGRHIPADQIEEPPPSKFLNQYVDRESGKKFLEIVIAPEDKVRIIVE